MDLSKSYEFFQPEKYKTRIHIIGCGSVGSTLAENLVRCGLKNITLYDFDKVEAHNIVNQIFTSEDIGRYKVDALKDLLVKINPDIKESLKVNREGWKKEFLSGYVFLCVDDIEIRKKFVEKHFNNLTVKAVFDFRTVLTSAQHYAADWSDLKQKQNLLKSMDFTHEEASAEAPVSACGITLGVATTVRLIVALGVNNFINFLKENKLRKFIMIDGFNYILDAFE